ncbi:MAG: hypothetical protein EOO41_03870, partial [Methanobacteriota archaeon]
SAADALEGVRPGRACSDAAADGPSASRFVRTLRETTAALVAASHASEVQRAFMHAGCAEALRSGSDSEMNSGSDESSTVRVIHSGQHPELEKDAACVRQGALTVLRWGHIVTDRSGWATCSCIYPAGYTARRVWWGVHERGGDLHRVTYEVSVLDAGVQSTPTDAACAAPAGSATIRASPTSRVVSPALKTPPRLQRPLFRVRLVCAGADANVTAACDVVGTTPDLAFLRLRCALASLVHPRHVGFMLSRNEAWALQQQRQQERQQRQQRQQQQQQEQQPQHQHQHQHHQQQFFPSDEVHEMLAGGATSWERSAVRTTARLMRTLALKTQPHSALASSSPVPASCVEVPTPAGGVEGVRSTCATPVAGTAVASVSDHRTRKANSVMATLPMPATSTPHPASVPPPVQQRLLSADSSACSPACSENAADAVPPPTRTVRITSKRAPAGTQGDAWFGFALRSVRQVMEQLPHAAQLCIT